MNYVRPTSAPISSSWSGHRNRRPPSQEPGTDYACAHGTRLAAPSAGRVVAMQDGPGSAHGRYVTFDLDDGRRVRWLHLSKILVRLGARITAGQIVAVSGSSAWGREYGGDPHVHVSLFPSHSYGGFGPNSTIDFEKHVGASAAGGSATPSPSTPATPESEEDEEMPLSFINVQGKAKSHEAGLFAVMRSNSGILFAKRVTKGAIDPAYPTIPHTQLPAWQKTMVFYELTD